MTYFRASMFIFLFILQIFTQHVCAVSGVKYDLKSMDKWESVKEVPWSYMNTSRWDNYWLFCPSCENKLERCKEDNNLLWTNFINGSNADALEINVRFTIKNCRCHYASLSFFPYESDGNTKPDDLTLSMLLNEHLVDRFFEYDNFPSSKKVVQEYSTGFTSFYSKNKGMYIGFQSNGGCIAILDLTINPIYCGLPKKPDDHFCFDFDYTGNLLSVSLLNDSIVTMNESALEETKITFFATVPGFKDSNYSFIWTHNGNLLKGSEDSKHSIANSENEGSIGQSILSIHNLNISDSGTYDCKVSSEYGYAHRIFNLNVKKRTRITNAPQNIDMIAGGNAMFNCSANNDDSLNFKWLKDGLPIQSEDRFNFSQNLLIINNVTKQDSGSYTCVVESDLDWDEASATLFVQDVPDPPEEVLVECFKDHAFLVWRWANDNGAPILHYIIQYNGSLPIYGVEETSILFLHNPFMTFAAIPMSPWRTYSFQVIAQSKIGKSKPWNSTSICKTSEDVPHKNPDNVRVKYIEPNILSVTWTPMSVLDHNGKDFHYIIYWKTNLEETWNFTVVSNWRRNECQLKVAKLSVSDGYYVKMIAANHIGPANAIATEIFVEKIIDEENTSIPWFIIVPVIVLLIFLLIIIIYCYKTKMNHHS